MPQVNYDEIPTYEEMPTTSWQNNPDLYPQHPRQNNTQNIPANNRAILTCLMWMFIFFSPTIALLLCKRFLSQIETFCQFTGCLGVAMLFLTLFVCASQQIPRR